MQLSSPLSSLYSTTSITTMLRQSLLRSSRAAAGGYGRVTVNAAGGYGRAVEQKRAAHAISNPTLANIEKRWEAMAPQEQADLWMALRDRMKTNWSELTLQEKKAGMFALHSPYFGRRSSQSNQSSRIGAIEGSQIHTRRSK